MEDWEDWEDWEVDWDVKRVLEVLGEVGVDGVAVCLLAGEF